MIKFPDYIFWIVFIGLSLVMFLIDLYVTEHRVDKIRLKSSFIWSGIWIGTAIIFGLFIYLFKSDSHKWVEYLTGYFIELSLSIDNLFVFIIIFSFMNISHKIQPHILKWGILSAIVMRIIFIMAGVALIQSFHFTIYIFGVILLYAAVKMLRNSEDSNINFKKNFLIKYIYKKFNVIDDYEGKHFFLKRNNKTVVTKVLITLLLIESADLIFAVDSIPAILAITQDFFIVVTSNILAVMGLRSIYFALAGLTSIFSYLKYGVAAVLFYVAVKMLVSDLFHIEPLISLFIILFILAISIIISVVKSKKTKLV